MVQALCYQGSAIGLLQRRCGIDQLFGTHVVAPRIDDLTLGKPDGATRLRRTTVAAVGVQRGEALADLLALGHVLPAAQRHEGVHEARPAVGVEQDIEHRRFGHVARELSAKFLRAAWDLLPRNAREAQRAVSVHPELAFELIVAGVQGSKLLLELRLERLIVFGARLGKSELGCMLAVVAKKRVAIE